jgi:HEAT repeat protein
MHNPASEDLSVRLGLVLLLGQGFFYGFGLVLWYVAANTLFLVDWSAERMPWVFIAVGLFVSAFSYGITALQRRWSTARVVLAIGLALVAFNVLARLGLLTALARWVSLALMVSYFLGLQMAFITLGLLAGRLFDIRQMKRLFPAVLSGFHVGFILGGLCVPLIMRLIGGAPNLLVGTALSGLISLVFLIVSSRRFRSVLARPVTAGREAPAPRLRDLLREPYVRRAFIYQVLSSIGTLLVLFILLRVAGAQFPTADSLASFFGGFGAVRNIANVLFALLMSGWLLTRFGLGFGLTANPAGVGLVVVVLAAAGLAATTGSPAFFWVAVIAVALDVVLSESLTLPSLKTVYQALPAREQQEMQTVVEGIGVPVAYGITGILLLLLNALGLTILHLVVFTLFMVVPRLVFGLLLYRDYAGTLLRALSRRILGDTELSLGDPASLAVVDRLLHSADLGDIRLALDLLERDGHATLGARLAALLTHPDAVMRREALGRLARLQRQPALTAVEQCLQRDHSPAVRGAAVHALCALQEADATERVIPYLDDPEAEARQGAMVGLLRYGSIAGILAAGQRVTALAQAAEPARRMLAAQVIGAVGISHFYQPLVPLLRDADAAVRRRALGAARHVAHPRLVPLLIENLGHGATRSAAVAALTGSGELILPWVRDALAGESGYAEETLRRLVRVCGQIKGTRVIDLLTPHCQHPSHAMQQEVLLALHHCGYRAPVDARAPLAALRDTVGYGLRLLLARHELGDHEALALLHAALAQEFDRARQRILLLLSFRYDSRALLTADARLRRGSHHERAVVIEMLDVTLSGEERPLVLPLLDEGLSWAQRRAALDRYFTLPAMSRDERLVQIMTDAATWPRPWTRACALFATRALASPGPAAAAAAIWPGGTHMLEVIEKVALLKAVNLFADTPDEVLAAVTSICEEVEVPAGGTFITEGELGDCMYVIVEGEVQVHSHGRAILSLGAGKSVGELAVLDPEPRAASVTALQKTRLFRIDKEAFDEVIADRPEIASGVIRALCQRLRETTSARPR